MNITTYRNDTLKHYRERRAEGHRPEQALRIAQSDAKYGRLGHRLTRIQMRKQRDFPTWAGEEAHLELPTGWVIKSRIERDTDYGPPWEESDGHGIVSNWEHGTLDESRWLLHDDNGSKRYYDWRATLEIAKRDGWGPGNKMDAVRSDFDYLSGWCNDQWYYVGLIVELYDEHDCLINQDSCWGFESTDIANLIEQMRDWSAILIREHRRTCREAEHAEHVQARFHDAMENAL